MLFREDGTMKPDKPIKVLQLIARTNLGGPAVLLAELIRNFDSHKVKSLLITGYCDDDEIDYFDESAMDVSTVRIAGMGRAVSPIKDLGAFFSLIREIRRFKPNVIHTHTAKAGVLGRVAGIIAAPKAKLVHTYHGHLLTGYFGKRKTYFICILERILSYPTDKIISIGNRVKNDLVDVGIGTSQKHQVIFPGIQTIKFQSKFKARNSLGLMPNNTYLVFVGRLTKIKRPDRLLDIARFLKSNYPSTQLLVAGGGDLFEATRKFVKSEDLPVILLGWRTDTDLIFSAADIAILCSDNEGIPITLIQASQAGLPIVSTNVGSVEDIVVDGETGILTEVNSKSLIHAINHLLSNPEKIARFGQAGKERAAALFSLSGMIRAHEDLYSQVIKKIN
jgi:glycosyltransferase involved in cell wall biosynthesis